MPLSSGITAGSTRAASLTFGVESAQGRIEAADALSLTLEHCSTGEMKLEAVAAVAFKCDLLWSILDAIAAGQTPCSD